ncbi:unnamed protein product [Amoebophrya sp. A120]|nr:unnamed protein product [Amoebophrya sp. A120]|eukprot:GSA120T00010660001.1
MSECIPPRGRCRLRLVRPFAFTIFENMREPSWIFGPKLEAMSSLTLLLAVLAQVLTCSAVPDQSVNCHLQWFKSGAELTAATCPGLHAYGEAGSAERCCQAVGAVPLDCDVRYLFRVHDKHLARANTQHHCCEVATSREGAALLSSWTLVAARYGCTSQTSWLDWSQRSPCLAAWWTTGSDAEDSSAKEGNTVAFPSSSPLCTRARYPYPDQVLWTSSVAAKAQHDAVLELQTDEGFRFRDLLYHCCGRVYVPDDCDVRYRLNYHDQLFRVQGARNDHFCCLSESLFVARAYGCMHYGSGLLLQWEPDLQSVHRGISDLFAVLQRPVLGQLALWTDEAGTSTAEEEKTASAPAPVTSTTERLNATTATSVDEGNSSGTSTSSEVAGTSLKSQEGGRLQVAEVLVRCLSTPFQLHECENQCAHASWGLADVEGYVRLDYEAPGLLLGSRRATQWWYLTPLREPVPSDQACVDLVAQILALCRGGLADTFSGGKLANQCDYLQAQHLQFTPAGRLQILT